MFIRLGLLVAAIHVYFLWSLGAGFYYDSVDLCSAGEALLTEGGLHAFHSGPRYYVFQHLAPGLPLLWSGAFIVAGQYGWVLFAAVQHAIAAAALIYLLWVWRPLLTVPFIFLAAILVSCNPLYESLHNRLMTESMTGSMLMFGIAATSSLLLNRSKGTMPFVILSASAVVAIQVRTQSMVYFLIFILAVLLSRHERPIRSATLLCLVVVVCSVFVWPAYRFLVTGQAFLPNTSYLATRTRPAIQRTSQRYADDAIEDVPSSFNLDGRTAGEPGCRLHGRSGHRRAFASEWSGRYCRKTGGDEGCLGGQNGLSGSHDEANCDFHCSPLG